MYDRYRVWTALLTALMLTAACASVCAQEPEEPEQIGAVRQPEDPAVEALLATNPSTPLEWVRAAKILADLHKPDMAKAFLKQVLDANLDQGQLVALEASFGTAIFVEMASRADLAPEAQRLNDAVLDAVNRHVRDPARLAGMIQQLQDPSAEVRYRALVELQRAGDAAVGPLFAVLADPGRAAEHANVRAALVKLGSDAADPLIAILESGKPNLAVEAIRVLADLEAEKVPLFLLAPFASAESDPEVRRQAEAALLKLSGRTPSGQAAARLLAQEAQEYFDRRRPLREDLEGRVEMWTWDADAGQLVKKSYLADDASLVLASRLARDAYSVAPENHQIRRLYLATMLEQAAYENGLDRPLAATEGTAAGRVAAFGPEVVEDLLAYALESGHAPVATAAARILGRLGKAETCLNRGPRPAPLVQAAWHADRRVRFAAVEAILELEPTSAFPGSSRVMQALAFFAASGGAPRVMVAGPNTAETQRVGGYLVALSCKLDTAVTGREAIGKLLTSPDYELALVDAALERPTVDFLLQELRHDSRTANLPVGVIARSGQLKRADEIARRDPLAEAFSRPHTAEAVHWQVERLLGLAGRERVLPAEREKQAAQAVKWLAQLSGTRPEFFDFSRAEESALSALSVPQWAPDAVVVLGNLGTPQCQRALVDLASRWTQPFELRVAAVKAFRESIQRNGILLTNEQILLQYDRYNQSETLDAGTQQVLGLILDCIEAPTRAEKQEKENANVDLSATR